MFGRWLSYDGRRPDPPDELSTLKRAHFHSLGAMPCLLRFGSTRGTPIAPAFRGTKRVRTRARPEEGNSPYGTRDPMGGVPRTGAHPSDSDRGLRVVRRAWREGDRSHRGRCHGSATDA